jgi:threonine dehydratase
MSDPKEAHIFVGVTVHDRDETGRIVRILRRGGFGTLDLSDDEVAKGHMRHMVGGHSSLARNELLYRFEFPERPGALMNFLSQMGGRWNISLFHYRSHGGDFGRVLVGMQVPRTDKKALKTFLDTLGYPYWDESDNPAYRLFLG